MSILYAGDIHANRFHAARLVQRASERGVAAIVQVGDFGYWPRIPSGEAFMVDLSEKLTQAKIPLFFVDGNHEDHMMLKHDAEKTYQIRPGIWYMPRGSITKIDGKKHLAVGGAVSVDQRWRTAGFDWFPEEVANMDQWSRCFNAGWVDVIVAHDVPQGVPLELTYPVSESIETQCIIHRAQMATLRAKIEPDLWVGGHYHQRVTQKIETTRIEVLGHDMAMFEDSYIVEG